MRRAPLGDDGCARSTAPAASDGQSSSWQDKAYSLQGHGSRGCLSTQALPQSRVRFRPAFASGMSDKKYQVRNGVTHSGRSESILNSYGPPRRSMSGRVEQPNDLNSFPIRKPPRVMAAGAIDDKSARSGEVESNRALNSVH